MITVDAHQHCWRLSDPGRRWPPPDLTAIHRDFAASDVVPLMAAHGVDLSVLVQSMTCEHETLRLLALADATPQIGAVVGWTDLKAPDAAARIAALARHNKLRGLRPMLQDLEDERWLDDDALAPAVHAMIAARLGFDALVRPHQLPALIRFARHFPALPIVVDHAAKPAIASGGSTSWQRDIARLAGLPNVFCKLSGLVTEAAPGWQPDDLAPWVGHVLACFGPHRVIWGSDWPVLNLASDYGRWKAVAEALLDHLDGTQRAAVFGLNACRFYRMGVDGAAHDDTNGTADLTPAGEPHP